MADPIKIVRDALVADAPVLAVFGQRLYRADAVPTEAPPPFGQLVLVSEDPNYDLDMTLDDITATVKIEIVGVSTQEGAAAIAAAMPLIRAALRAAGITVTDAADEPSGPADAQERTSFVRSLTAELSY